MTLFSSMIFITGMTGMALLILAQLHTNAGSKTAVPAPMPVQTQNNY